MYLDYWKFSRRPFGNRADSSMFFNGHESIRNAVSRLLYAIEEAQEGLAVVIGEPGTGKTTCLRTVMTSLDPLHFKSVFVSMGSSRFPDLARELVARLEGYPCSERRQDKLVERLTQVLLRMNDAGQKAVIFIEEKDATSPMNLDSVQLLTNMQDAMQGLFTIVLAGRPELGTRLNEPRRELLFQRIGVCCWIEGLGDRATMEEYIAHRLEQAGLSGDSIFTHAALEVIWNLSAGRPGLVNRLCALLLRLAAARGSKNIDAVQAETIGSRYAWRYHRVCEMRSAIYQAVSMPDAVYETVPSKEHGETIELQNPEEQEKIASWLAAERVNTLSDICDPFEKWNKAREEILATISDPKDLMPLAACQYA